MVLYLVNRKGMGMVDLWFGVYDLRLFLLAIFPGRPGVRRLGSGPGGWGDGREGSGFLLRWRGGGAGSSWGLTIDY